MWKVCPLLDYVKGSVNNWVFFGPLADGEGWGTGRERWETLSVLVRSPGVGLRMEQPMKKKKTPREQLEGGKTAGGARLPLHPIPPQTRVQIPSPGEGVKTHLPPAARMPGWLSRGAGGG